MELQQMKGSVILQLLAPQVSGFYKANQNRINNIIDSMNKLMEEFFEYEGDKIKMAPAEPGQRPRAIYKPGKTKEEYQKRYNELMEQKQIIVT